MVWKLYLWIRWLFCLQGDRRAMFSRLDMVYQRRYNTKFPWFIEKLRFCLKETFWMMKYWKMLHRTSYKQMSENFEFVGNKAKERISKRVFQENKARQIFRKTNISYSLIRTRTCAYQGVRNVCFSENLTCFVFLKHPFWDSPFCLITDELLII